MKNNKVAVIGLGYVGLTFAITLAKVGFKVLGIENNERVFKSISKGKAQFYEEKIDKYLKDSLTRNKLNIQNNLNGINNCKIVFITIGTPINEKKKINLNNLFDLIKVLKNKLKNDTILVLRSTVKIGTTEKIQKILNTKKKRIFLAMCPERTAEGSALKEIHYLPQVIGTEDEISRKKLNNLFKRITRTTINFKKFTEAEVLKLIDNSYRDTMFGFANELARLGEYLKIDLLNIINKIKIKYPRTNVALPGTVGGPCLTKDPHILIESVKKKLNLPIIKSARHTNEIMGYEILKMIKKHLEIKVNKILICGVAFKGNPITSDIRGSLAKNIIIQTKKLFNNPKIDVLDKYVSFQDAKIVSSKSRYFDDIKKIKYRYDLILILNNSPYWKKIGFARLNRKLSKNGVIYDFWSSFQKNKNKKNYFRYGGGDIN